MGLESTSRTAGPARGMGIHSLWDEPPRNQLPNQIRHIDYANWLILVDFPGFKNTRPKRKHVIVNKPVQRRTFAGDIPIIINIYI